ncbi:hypothetical protein CMI47_14335 [Candidatus Pacearchaeota archaeon]|nr:hypothetical protein [Candidatus Pacearchaeota archaeon]
MIKVVSDDGFSTGWLGQIGLLVRIGKRHNKREVATVLTSRGIETWPLDSCYEYEVISESR